MLRHLLIGVVSLALFAPSLEAADDVPAEIAQRKIEKREVRERRTAYMNEIHLAAPGVDWRQVEAENRHAAFLERQALAAAGRGVASWEELGSANQAGRTHVTAYSHQTGALYVGSSLGGVWKGDVAGSSWSPISDGLGIGGHALVVSSGTPEVLTVSSGTSIYVSRNDGLTWSPPTGLPASLNGIIRVVADRALSNRVYALVVGQYWDGSAWNSGSHVYRSDDGGLTYSLAYSFPITLRADLWIDRVNGGSLYVVREDDFYRSDDEGDTFTLVGTIPSSVTEIVLTGSEAGAPTFYAAVRSASGWRIWQSTDAGVTWTMRTLMSDFWGSSFCASIENPNLLLFGGVECFRTTNGGVFFSKVNNWYDYYGDPANKLHADFPGRIECEMIGTQETFFLNTDGGTYKSTDGVAAVQDISVDGLGVSQYYTVFTSQTDPYLVVAGAQDQGYQQSDPASAPYLVFDQLISGDYAQATSTVRDHNWLYTVYPGFVLVQQNENPPQSLAQVDFPSGSNHLWLPPLHADPVTPTIVYLGADHMWEFKRSGSSWLRTELPQDFTTAGGSYISAIGIAPSDPEYRYVAVNGGVMWYSHDGGATWTPSGGTTGGHYFHGHGITVSPTNPLIAWVSGSGYSGPGVYKTTDGGATWTPMGDGLPSTMVFEIALDNPAQQTLYAATEAGPYEYDNGTGTWVSIRGLDAPLTTYWDVESVPELGVMRFATYGRGIWDYTPGEIVDVATAPPAARFDVRLAPMPARTRATVSFSLDAAGEVAIDVFDLAGRRVVRPVTAAFEAGAHDVPLDLTQHGRNLEAGVYFVRVVSAATT
jgi:hypothetical protein